MDGGDEDESRYMAHLNESWFMEKKGEEWKDLGKHEL